MSAGNATIVALLANPDALEHAVLSLGAAGVTRKDILIACAQRGAQTRLIERHGVTALCEPGSGNVENALYEMQLQRTAASYFANSLAGDRVLVILHRTASADEYVGILSTCGADFGPSDGALESRESRIPLRAERSVVQKYLKEVGTVNVRREVTTEVARFDVELIREDLVIERVEPGSVSAQETRIPIRHEDVRVTKRTIVDSELRIRREQYHEVRHLEQTLRREEPHIQTSGDVDISGG